MVDPKFHNNLRDSVQKLPVPADYFSGIQAEPWFWPQNLLLFSRLTYQDLQRRKLASRPHHRHVLVINLKGDGVINLDGTPYPLATGQAHLVFPYQFHTYHDIADNQITWLFLTFELESDQELECLRHRSVTLTPSIFTAINQVLDAYQTNPTLSQQQTILHHMALLLVQLVRDVQDEETPRHSPPLEAARLLKSIRHYQSDALPQPLSTSDLAAKLHLSDSRLRTIFREAFGTSLGSYLRNYRFHEAVAMMRHSRASLTEIASACGFGSASAFSRSFRHWSGVSPSAFRARMTK